MAELLRDEFMPEEDGEADSENGYGPKEDLGAEAREKKHVEPFTLVTVSWAICPL